MADRLLAPDAAAVEECVAFIEAHTLRVWHGRARAMMSRRLKHCRLTAGQSDRLLRVILVRLISGKFAEQFKDQLRLALQLDAAKVYEVARSCERAEAEHVRPVWRVAPGPPERLKSLAGSRCASGKLQPLAAKNEYFPAHDTQRSGERDGK